MKRQGRRVGTKVKLTPYARTLYPSTGNKVGKITERMVLTQGHGLARGAYHSYRISYFVRFEGDKRDYLHSSDHLMSVK